MRESHFTDPFLVESIIAMLDLSIWLFVHVVRAGSFAAAGRKLSMPPTTISRRLQALEAAMGVRLLQRSTRQLNMTAAGRSSSALRAGPGRHRTRQRQPHRKPGRASGSLRGRAGGLFRQFFHRVDA
jgi:DNA-binding transcriptional LysR family regulator